MFRLQNGRRAPGSPRSAGRGTGSTRAATVRWVAGLLAVGVLAATPLPAGSAAPRLSVATADDPAQLTVLPDSATVTRGDSTTIDALANDSGPDGEPLVAPLIEITQSPQQGTAEVSDPDGDGPLPPQLSYTPHLSAGPQDTLTYRVSDGAATGSALVTLTVDNATPVAVDDTAAVESAPGTVVVIDVLANDSDVDGGTLAVTAPGTPSLGVATLGPDGRITYDPTDGAAGADTFSYGLIDGQGGSATAEVRIDVSAPAPQPPPVEPPPVQPPAPPPAPRTASASLPATAFVGDRITTDVRVSGFDATGATAQVRVRQEGGWTTVAAAPLGPAGGAVTWEISQQVAGVTPTRQATDVEVLVVVVPPDGSEVPAASAVVRFAAAVGVTVSGPLQRSDVPRSYRPGCPVKPGSLRRLQLNYWDYSGTLRRGTLIARTDAVADLTSVFSRAFAEGFRIKRMTPIDAYYKGGKRSPTEADKAAMKAGNTSAFNCRSVVGNPFKRSAHSYGIAIDINTFENPYVTRSTVYPPKARKYLRRSPCRTGMICRGGVVATAMGDRGWLWGARWSRPDYQHFSSTGG